MKRFNWHLTFIDQAGCYGAVIIPSNSSFHSTDVARVSKLAKDLGFHGSVVILNFERLEEIK